MTNNRELLAMAAHLAVSDVARRLGARPRDISDLFYQRLLRDDICPIVGGRRLIPQAYVAVIEAVLRDRRRQGGAKCPPKA